MPPGGGQAQVRGSIGRAGTIRPELNAKPSAAGQGGYDSRWLCVVTGGARDVMDRHPRMVTRLRASINVACRVAAGDRRTSYHATGERITIGIAGPDARERIPGLRRQLARIGRNRGWTITEDLS